MLPAMARTLFGTDGVRGVAGEKITVDLARSLGRAATHLSPARAPRVLIIRDTRESGEMLEAALAAGVAAAGGEASLGGVVPTPAAALAVLRERYDLAVVISASHNPYHDNGIKFFGPDGDKLSDAAEEAIERELDAAPDAGAPIGRVRVVGRMLDDYVAALRARFSGLDLTGVRVLLDCANGATYQAAPGDLPRARRERHDARQPPDGRNINDRVGSTHPQLVQACMRDGGFDIGFAFDGDGDRVVAVDRTGRLADGDELIALAAVHLKAQGRLSGDGVAMTVMTNFGFHRAMRDAGITVATTKVGDRYVLAGLREKRLHARRRAVRAHHRARLRPLGRRHRLRPADARGARRPRPRDRARATTRCPSSSSTCPSAAPRRSSPRPRPCARRSRSPAAGWPTAGASSCAPAAPSPSCA